jgi:colanic acid biosynthesis glycosyl transferase WcaI
MRLRHHGIVSTVSDSAVSPRVVLVTSNFWPERTGIGQVATEFAQFLASRGIDVHVVTGMPYYPEWRIYPEYRGSLQRTERLGDVTIHRAWHHARPAPGALSRIAHEATLSLFSIPNLASAMNGADVAYIVSPDLSHAFAASLVAKAMGVPRVLMIQDVMPDAAIELGMLRNRFVIGGARRLARATYALADEIRTLGEGMRQRIARETTSATRITILPNAIDVDELWTGSEQGIPFRDQFVPAGTFAVVHSGNMGEKQDLELILRAARRLREYPGIHFFVFGDGAVKGSFLGRRAEWDLENVSHFPFQERAMLPHMLHGADVLLVSQASSVVDIVVPSKLATAFGAGAMVVASCAENSETARLVRESGGGVVISAGDDEALARVIVQLKTGELDSRPYREAGRAYARDHFDREQAYEAEAIAIRARSGNGRSHRV